jgi:hypothetical protein
LAETRCIYVQRFDREEQLAGKQARKIVVDALCRLREAAFW